MFLVPTSMIHGSIGVILLTVNAVPAGTEGTAVLLAFVAGAVRVLGVLIILRTLRSKEVSRVMPVTCTYPTFVAILAYLPVNLGGLFSMKEVTPSSLSSTIWL